MATQSTTVGQLLQKQREEKKLSLESVAHKTRIKVTFLQAIEEDAFQLIPSETYVRGFIRCYAKQIHLNPDEILNLYRNQAGPTRGLEANSPAASKRHLNRIKNHLFDFLTTMAGGTTAYSLGKPLSRAKD
jgi:cytoskeletal protein RodZ